MAKTRQTEIYQFADGFYAGVMKDDGTMAPGAYRLTDEDIMTMFTTLFNNHCEANSTDRLLMQDSEGSYFVTLRVKGGQAAEPAQEPAKKAPARRGRKKKMS